MYIILLQFTQAQGAIELVKNFCFAHPVGKSFTQPWTGKKQFFEVGLIVVINTKLYVKFKNLT